MSRCGLGGCSRYSMAFRPSVQLAGKKTTMTKYRADIDGLRAIAILPVLLFHAKFQIFGGGFVGVDVFFVISGYLITSLIVGELESTGFSIIRFYERRIRRILPALFTVVIFSSIISYWLFTPADLKEFGQSAVAATLSSSNILFWLNSG
jgi:peptidoglycan/LPS O-acetylase OafA/YrhL